jgi:Ca-activated chloride channel family protein
MKLLHGLLLSTIICLTSAAFAKAQARPQVNEPTKSPPTPLKKYVQEVGEGDAVRVTTSLVRVPVAVRDRDGRYVIDLKKEDFKVYENGAKQRIGYFGRIEEPVSVVLLIDISCSIEKPKDTIAAALTFIEQLRPTDSVLPIAFGTNIYALLTESTRDRALLRERILGLPDKEHIPCDHGTRLYDAVDFVIHHILTNGTGRRAVILLTDGKPTFSTHGSRLSTLRDASELGVPFYSLRLSEKLRPGGNAPFAGFPNDPPAERAKLWFFNRDFIDYIADLANLSGGRYYPEVTGDDLKKYFNQIGEELRHQYLITYYPSTLKDEEQRRKIKVRVNKQKVSVRARDSYIYIPSGK